MNQTINCFNCGKICENCSKCSRCSITPYCSKECQAKDWKNHRLYFCREEGKKLQNCGAALEQQEYMMNKEQRKVIAEMQAERVRKALHCESIKDIGLYCNICGDLELLKKMNGIVVC
jgi:hypothetical protein